MSTNWNLPPGVTDRDNEPDEESRKDYEGDGPYICHICHNEIPAQVVVFHGDFDLCPECHKKGYAR